MHSFTVSKKHVTPLLMASVALSALMSTQALSAPQQQDDDTTTVIVTAQKREQRLQDVPIAVTTLSAKVLQEAGVRDIKDLQILTPGLTVTSTQNESVTTARIRGVGTVGDNPGLESSVGVVIDGVYRPRNGVSFEDLGEIERIEVIKGPQGTLFGKNTSAGVINILTKKPLFKFGADGEATVGSYGQKGLSASVTGPLLDEILAGRLYVAKRERDGFNDVALGVGPRTQTDDIDQNFTTIRGQLLAVPHDNLTVRLIADYSRRDEYCCTAVPIRVGPTGAILNALTANRAISPTAVADSRLSYANRSTHQSVHDSGVTVEANLKLDWFGGSELTSVTSSRDWKTQNGQDIDYTGADILYRNDDGTFNARFKTFTQEFRLAGGNEKLNWLVGGFYSDEQLSRNDSYIFGAHYETFLSLLLSTGTDPARVSALTGFAPGQSFRAGQGAIDTYRQDAKSIALFTNNSYKFTDKLEASFGLRYTQETKDLTASYTNTDGGLACAAAAQRSVLETGIWAMVPEGASEQALVGRLCLPWANFNFASRSKSEKIDETDLSGTAKLSYHIAPDIMVYGSVAKGYKAGGFNLDRAQTGITPNASLAFNPETVQSYELGIKSVLFAKSLTLNVTAFDQKYDDFQLNTFLGTAFTVETIPELTSKGVDIDLYWKTPLQGLSVQAGASIADTVYGSFKASDLLTPSNFDGLSLLPGNSVSFAPKWTGSAALSWGGTLAGLRIGANVTAKYTDKFNTGSDLLPAKEQEAFTLVNGRLLVGAPNRNWTLELWGQNITDVTYKQVVFNAPLQGTAFSSTLQSSGQYAGSFYNPAADSQTYMAYLGAPKTYGLTLRLKY